MRVSGSINSLQQVKVMSLVQGSPAGREQQEMAQKQGYDTGSRQSRGWDVKLPPLSVWSSPPGKQVTKSGQQGTATAAIELSQGLKAQLRVETEGDPGRECRGHGEGGADEAGHALLLPVKTS